MQCTAFYSILHCNASFSLHCITQLCIRLYSQHLLRHCKAFQCIVIWSKLHCTPLHFLFALHCTGDMECRPYIFQHFWLCADNSCVSWMLNYCNALFLKVLLCAVHCTEKPLLLISVTAQSTAALYVCVQCVVTLLQCTIAAHSSVYCGYLGFKGAQGIALSLSDQHIWFPSISGVQCAVQWIIKRLECNVRTEQSVVTRASSNRSEINPYQTLWSCSRPWWGYQRWQWLKIAPVKHILPQSEATDDN